LKTFIVVLLTCRVVFSQVCCSPTGAGQAGGGVLLASSGSQWPNSIINDPYWRWLSRFQLSARSNSGNIEYGGQFEAVVEFSKAISGRSVAFVRLNAGAGEIREQVTFLGSNSSVYTGFASLGSRHSLGQMGDSWTQLKLIIPASPYYSNEQFSFPSQEVIRAEVQILSNFQMPWGMRYPMIFNHLSGIILLRKNLSNNTQVTSDNLGIVHLATTAYLKKLNFSPFIQFQSHQLLLQSVDGSNSSKRWLATGTLGIDISVGFHIVKNWSIRFGTPIYTWSSRNGFPDGTFPGMFMGVSYGFDGVLATENH